MVQRSRVVHVLSEKAAATAGTNEMADKDSPTTTGPEHDSTNAIKKSS